MNVKNLVLPVAALTIAGLTAWAVKGWLSDQQQLWASQKGAPAAVAEAAVNVLVAKTRLPTGTILKSNHLRWQAWPDETIAKSYLVKGKSTAKSLFGTVVRAAIAPDQPVTLGQVVQPGDRGFLAAVLMPGMRAVSVRINASTGISGLVFPGDRVDLILSHSIRRGRGEETRVRRASETVLQNVRVLAVDQNADDRKDKPAVGKTATLEVTPKQAELIAVVVELGKLSLSLRSLGRRADDAAVSEMPVINASHTWDRDASRLLGEPGQVSGVTVIHGGKKGNSPALAQLLAK